jgi:hypothetical protein
VVVGDAGAPPQAKAPAILVVSATLDKLALCGHRYRMTRRDQIVPGTGARMGPLSPQTLYGGEGFASIPGWPWGWWPPSLQQLPTQSQPSHRELPLGSATIHGSQCPAVRASGTPAGHALAHVPGFVRRLPARSLGPKERGNHQVAAKCAAHGRRRPLLTHPLRAHQAWAAPVLPPSIAPQGLLPPQAPDGREKASGMHCRCSHTRHRDRQGFPGGGTLTVRCVGGAPSAGSPAGPAALHRPLSQAYRERTLHQAVYADYVPERLRESGPRGSAAVFDPSRHCATLGG